MRKNKVLVGYNLDDNGIPMLKSPIYEDLTDKHIGNFTPESTFNFGDIAPGPELICVTEEYRQEGFQLFEIPNALELPVLNQCFVIFRDAPPPANAETTI